jgi:ferritin-like metal-binding protein YciE
MADTNARDAKLVQYLAEAHRKEKELEQALELHIGMTELASQRAYKKRLREHHKETKRHARDLERRIKKLGGDLGALDAAVGLATKAAGRGLAAVKGQTHVVRGTGEEEKLLKNAKTEYFNEHEEIATYSSIETLAESVGDSETAKLARQIKREEERMARYLEGLIPRLTKAVARAEVPSDQRRTTRRSTRKRSSSGTRAPSTRRSSAKRSTAKRSTAKRSTASSRRSSPAKRATSRRSSSARGRSGGAKKTSSRSPSGTRRRSGGSSSRSRRRS